MAVKVIVADLVFDSSANVPVMLLKEETGSRTLPVWIGLAEANAIGMIRSGEKPQRPLTHDLIKLMADALDTRLEKIVIDDMRENTFFAKLFLRHGNEAIFLDARPSDAVALALRFGAPIFVEEKVFENKSPSGANPEGQPEKNPHELRKNLRDIDPSDFGKFSLG